MYLHQLECCGMREIVGLATMQPDEFYNFVKRTNGSPGCAYIIFNGVKSEGYVERFRAFLLKERLGEVVDAQPRENPNTSRTLDVGIWHIDRAALHAWLIRETEKRAPKKGAAAPGTDCTVCEERKKMGLLPIHRSHP